MNPVPIRRLGSPSSAVRSTVEYEIKLSIDADFRLPRLPGTPLPKRLLTSIYYDTPQYDLAHGGITLRHRTERGKQAWQLKLPVLNARQEVELPGRHTVPPRDLMELLMVHVDDRALAPVATLRVWRTGIRVPIGAGRHADVTVDHVAVITKGTVIQRFRELEIERLDGRDGDLRDLEHRLRAAGARDHDGRPKLFRALSLPPPGPRPPPAAEAPAIEHVRRALGRHVWWLAAHDPGARLGREPECVHQMRVAARQLRAVLHAARPLLVREWEQRLQAELAWLSRLLGPARDLDVQLEYFTREADRLSAPDRRPLMAFIDQLQAQRRTVHEALLSELKSARYLQLIRHLRQAAHDPTVVDSTASLQDLARREFTALRKAIRQAGPSPTNAKIHEIRIKTKRARYAAELAEPAVGKPAARFIKQARALQDLLGRHQDALQAEAYVRAFLKHSTGVRAGFVGGLLVERQRQRRKSARKKFPRLCKRLVKRGKQAWE